MIDVTDHNVTDDELAKLQDLSQKYKLKIVDTNWFGGIWDIIDYLRAENKLNDIVNFINSKKFSPFERYICAYHFTSNRGYAFSPKDSTLQIHRNYVEVLNNGDCDCVGFATILKRLCDKLDIECVVQSCLAKDRFGEKTNHANNLVYIKDNKYHIDGLFYSDPSMDCLGFADLADNSSFWKLNSLVLPITDIGKIMIKNWDDAIIEMDDFQSLYYSRELSQDDRAYLSKFFSEKTIDNIMSKKYCNAIEDDTLWSALFNIGMNEEQILKNKKSFEIIR